MFDCVAFIPTRRGSKGVFNKNMREFCGMPLLHWTHNQAVNSKKIEAVFHYSDYTGEELCLPFGDKPVKLINRPSIYTGDNARILPCINAACHDMMCADFIDGKTKIVFLQATSPLRLPEDIDNAIWKYENQSGGHALSVVSGTMFDDMCQWGINSVEKASITPQGNYDPYNRGNRGARSVFVENGSIYVFSMRDIVDRGNYCYPMSKPYIMKQWQSQEIDTEEDFVVAERLMKRMVIG